MTLGVLMSAVHVRSIRTLLALLTAMALGAAFLAAPAPAHADADGAAQRASLMQAALAASTSTEAPSRSYAAVDDCAADPADDVQSGYERSSDQPAPDQEDRADILEYCANYGPTLSLTVSTAELTDPEADENWTGGTFIGWFIDVDGDSEGDYFVDYSLNTDGVLSARVLEWNEDDEEFNIPGCSGDSLSATYTEAAYGVNGIQPECLGGATDIAINVAIFYDTRPEEGDGPGTVYFDSAPEGGSFEDAAPRQARRAIDRLWGDTRIGTSIAIAMEEFGDQDPAVVYLARAFMPEGADAAPPDAVTGGVLTDGPIILVPSEGDVPPEVRAAIDELDPDTVIALGGTTAISDGMLEQASQGRDSDRVEGPTRIETAIAISQRQFPDGADEVYIARAFGTLADAVVGGVLTEGPILLVPTEGPTPPQVRAEIDRVDPDVVIALGGELAVGPTALETASEGRDSDRLWGPGRVETSIAISQYAFPLRADEIFLARADVLADAVAGGVLTNGPIVLVPSDVEPDENRTSEEIWNTTWSPIANEISRVAPDTVTALGGVRAITDRVLDLARNS